MEILSSVINMPACPSCMKVTIRVSEIDSMKKVLAFFIVPV